jgi:hypothetical protein
MATPEHGSSPAGAQEREGNTGLSAQASLGLRWRWSGGATKAMNDGGLNLAGG